MRYTTTAARQQEMVSYLQRHGRTAVATLANEFDVSEITVRRDLAAMSNRGLIKRTHGGAVGLASRGAELPLAARRHRNQHVKSMIAAAALEHVLDGHTIALDGGTTTGAIAEQMTGRTITVMPMSVPLIAPLCVDDGPTVILPGGLVRRSEGTLVGPLALASLSRLRFDVGILGTCAVDRDGTVLAHDLDDAEIKRAIVTLSDRVILVGESWKFMRRAAAPVCDLSDIDVIVTDDQLTVESSELIANGAPDAQVIRVRTEDTADPDDR
ncbi:DeoR/GlpR family DNA-binding transcription regulator [Rhodococcus sp. UNC23MFCrub1.1]|uniref:DeoR/GlpR family DNA-binding transcription regulator n=1 Tax=Rhodococcus sp. UNC23MFCrub1.1 TaxID=1449068 RepID=UPI000690C1D8|nr:DeoR/GlpR family DNA-binding transcription regulator [Rhodococcus sp. UNC23MFCrub1.1]